MKNSFLTIDDLQVKGKKVLVRVDINSPIDPVTKKITDDERLQLHTGTTIKELSEMGARVIVISHQGRPGDSDFISLAEHAEYMSRQLGKPVKFVDEIFSSHVKEEINKLKDGEVMLLENVRFYAEESIERPADALTKVHLVRSLASYVDCFVNDAFATIHRSQPSLVGFGELLPTAAGRVIELELKALNGVLQAGRKPAVFVLGGAKVDDSIKAIGKLLANGTADTILTGGLLANALLVAKGYDVGPKTMEVLKGKGLDKFLPLAKEVLKEYDSQIETPVDVAIMDATRKDIHVSELPNPYPIADIGRETVGRYCKILEQAKTVVLNSPLGIYENKEYAYGTMRVLNCVASLKAYKVVGGGHIDDVVNSLGLRDKFNHVSSGGRAILYYLSKEKLPVVQMLERAKDKWGGKAKQLADF
ncbi:MAG: phosphoglycerate kinase [Candidatus Aenigmarchaeota archaeon]|nr:phosphoglycerate kinase [Candidatus Aenigmarchaeota archaeon]